jgi:hypothetical protein
MFFLVLLSEIDEEGVLGLSHIFDGPAFALFQFHFLNLDFAHLVGNPAGVLLLPLQFFQDIRFSL